MDARYSLTIGEPLIVTVEGIPVPKGSTRAFVIGGRAVTTNANSGTKTWEQRIATEVQSHRNGFYVQKTGKGDDGVSVEIEFWFPRTKADVKEKKLHCVKPDLDKLVRACLDALTNIVFEDDSQVMIIKAEKNYLPFGEGPPKAVLTLRQVAKNGQSEERVKNP